MFANFTYCQKSEIWCLEVNIDKEISAGIMNKVFTMKISIIILKNDYL